MALLKNGFHDLPDTFRTYIIKKDGVEIGELKYDRGRWKSAGGPAWKGTYFKFMDGMDYTYFSKDRKNVLHFFKTGEAK
jgi:hypothetical protein